MNYPQGSQWRKWDLHVHTPASLIQYFGGDAAEAWENFISAIEALPAEFKVIGINDYIFIDGYRKVLQYKKNGRLSNIDLILPVVELRLDKFGGSDTRLSRVNFHVIFSDELEPEVIEQQFLNAITSSYKLSAAHTELDDQWQGVITRESLTDLGKAIIRSVPPARQHEFGEPIVEGFNNLCINLDKVMDTLESHFFKGRFLTAVGKTEWADIKWNDHSIAEKKNIINRAQFVFTSARAPEECKDAQHQLHESGVTDRLLDCSDAHHFAHSEDKDRLGKCFTWIKADTTFRGLINAFHEYEGRVYLGDMPPKLIDVQNNRTKYIKSIHIDKRADSTLDEMWFDGIHIELNPGLVAIIGNKGTGKSALSDLLGLLGNTRNGDHFSFLSNQRFRSAQLNRSEHFVGQLTWESGNVTSRALNENTDPNMVELVKYMPQGLFEDICNEIASSTDTKFDMELGKVIFSHVEAADRLGKETLEELIAHQTKETYAAIDIYKQRLAEVNRHIVQLEQRMSAEHTQQLEALIALRRDEVNSHELAKPAEVAPPSSQGGIEQDRLLAEIEGLSLEMVKQRRLVESAQHLREGSALAISSAEKLLAKIENFREQYNGFLRDSQAELDDLGIRINDVVQVEIETQPVHAKITQHQEARDRAELQLNVKVKGTPAFQEASLKNNLEGLQRRLDEPNRLYQEYQRALRNWELKKAEIIGDADAPDTLEYYKQRLADLMDVPQQLRTELVARDELAKEIFRRIQNLAFQYQRLYRPVQRFADSELFVNDELQLRFDVSIINVDLNERLFDWIARNVSGSFYGPSGERALADLVSKHTFDSEQSVIAFLRDLLDHLQHDKKLKDSPEVTITSQLKRGRTAESLYDYIFSLDFLRPRFVLKLGNKGLSQLSPGERGALLLIFYLLIDKDNVPLIIDQPEENLDNETVYRLLTKCIKATKQDRQVIIVTHNPNLAVVCDAEQIISCSIDKTHGNRIVYTAGAIEDPEINKRIVDVLEGTKPAFDKRNNMYHPLIYTGDRI